MCALDNKQRETPERGGKYQTRIGYQFNIEKFKLEDYFIILKICHQISDRHLAIFIPTRPHTLADGVKIFISKESLEKNFSKGTFHVQMNIVGIFSFGTRSSAVARTRNC